MNDRPVKIPGPDHPITIAPAGQTYRVIFKGEVLAQSANATELNEANYPPAIYFPRQDVRMELLNATDHKTYCPYKGQANYFSIKTAAGEQDNAVWSYEQPYDSVGPIRELLAFYPSKMDSIEKV